MPIVKDEKPELGEFRLESVTPEPLQTPNISPRKRGYNHNEPTEDGSPRKKQSSPTKKTQAPSSLAEAGEEDRMLFRMKDEEGKSWSEIRDAWAKMTGNEVTVNLVKKRYYRLKAAFTVFNDDDIPRLLEADKAVDAKIEQIEKDRCNLIARDIAGAGGESYSVATIQKKLKEIKRN